MQKLETKAQSSIEFLLVLLGFFSALAIIVPAVSFTANASLFASDAVNAKSFVQEIETTVQDFALFSDGSVREISFSPINAWQISSNNKELKVFVQSSVSEKEFVILFPNQIVFLQKTFSGPSSIKIRKTGNLILIENN